MKVRELLKELEGVDPELDVMTKDGIYSEYDLMRVIKYESHIVLD